MRKVGRGVTSVRGSEERSSCLAAHPTSKKARAAARADDRSGSAGPSAPARRPDGKRSRGRRGSSDRRPFEQREQNQHNKTGSPYCGAPTEQGQRSKPGSPYCQAPTGPLRPVQQARRRAVGAGPLLSVPVFCFAMVRHSRQHSTRDGDEVEHRSDRQHSRREPAAAPKSPPEQQPKQMIVVAAPVPPPLPAPGQLARDGKVEGSRRVGAPSETPYIPIRTYTRIYPAAAR